MISSVPRMVVVEHILHSIFADTINLLRSFFRSTSPVLPTIVGPMKPVIPSDPTSLPVQTGTVADAGREESSLHGEILARLRDYIVEGNIADGGRVRQLSEHELGELFDVMGGLEGLAGRLACENITDEEIAGIERLHYEMYGFYLHRDMHGYFQINQLIHQKIVEASRNAALLATYANFAGRIRRIRYSANFARKRERWGEAMREHEMILEALRRRAGSELSDILFQHLRNKRTAAIAHLSEPDQTAKSAKPTLSETAS